MGLTPEQIAMVMSNENARSNALVNLAEAPLKNALMAAQVAAAQRKEPTIPVQTPYGTINMTTDQAMRVADQSANRELRQEALDIQKANAAALADSRAIMASIAGQNAATARDRLAEAKAENLREEKRDVTAQQDRERNNILRHVDTYTKNPKGAAVPLASAINKASSEVMPEIVWLDEDNTAFTIDPTIFNVDDERFTKERIQQMAKKEGMSENAYIKKMVSKYQASEATPTFNEQFETTRTPLR